MNNCMDRNDTSAVGAKAIKTPISGLSIGMYVSKLDRDWLETPFLYQGFIIATFDDIRILEKYCEYVWVEPLTEQRQSLNRLEVLKASASSDKRYANKVSVKQEYKRSRSVFKQSRQTTKTLLQDIVLGNVLDTKAAKRIVDNCIDSILNNESVMLWMTKLRNNDEYTSEHCLNVCIVAIAFGRQLGMEREELASLGMCGLLHDVGKMRVPNDILNKPGKLTPKEWKTMQAHATFGRNLLMTTKGLGQTVDVAYSHHERVDGKGYPRGVEGRHISRFAKIIAIVDTFDALTANRCYSKPITPSAAVKIIYNERGAHFDEDLVLRFIKTIGLYPPGTIVELTNGSLALTIERHHSFQHLPKVILIHDKSGKDLANKVVDLSSIDSGKLPRSFLIKTDHPDGYAGINIKDYEDFFASDNPAAI